MTSVAITGPGSKAIVRDSSALSVTGRCGNVPSESGRDRQILSVIDRNGNVFSVNRPTVTGSGDNWLNGKDKHGKASSGTDRCVREPNGSSRNGQGLTGTGRRGNVSSVSNRCGNGLNRNGRWGSVLSASKSRCAAIINSSGAKLARKNRWRARAAEPDGKFLMRSAATEAVQTVTADLAATSGPATGGEP